MGRKAIGHVSKKVMTHEEYLASDVWKCTDSPTGAHHWIEIQHTADGQFHTGLFYCKWCHDSKRFPIYWSQVNPARGGVIKEED